MTRVRTLWLGGAVLLALAAPSACGSDELLNPLGYSPPDAGKDVSHDAVEEPDTGVDAGPPIRSVETRSRFGALDPTNYLLDGDFEYSGMDALQYPWFGVDYSWIVTGARCRHGLRCVEIPLGQYAIGTFVWPDAGSIDVEYFAKPNGTGDCTEEVGGLVIPLADYNGSPPTMMQISADVPAPEADGWCHVTGNFPIPTDTGNTFWALLLAPRQQASGSILVDDASVRVPGGGSAALLRPAAPDLAKIAQRARRDFAARKPVPPRAEPSPVKNRTGRRIR